MKNSEKLFKAFISAFLLTILVVILFIGLSVVWDTFIVQFEEPWLTGKGEPDFFVCKDWWDGDLQDCNFGELLGQTFGEILLALLWFLPKVFLIKLNLEYAWDFYWIFNYSLLIILTIRFYRNLAWFKNWTEKRSKLRKKTWRKRIQWFKNFDLKTFYEKEIKRLWPGN